MAGAAASHMPRTGYARVARISGVTSFGDGGAGRGCLWDSAGDGGDAGGWRLDLPGIDRALADGARAVLLCNPHNPTGTVHPAGDLVELAEIAG